MPQSNTYYHTNMFFHLKRHQIQLALNDTASTVTRNKSDNSTSDSMPQTQGQCRSATATGTTGSTTTACTAIGQQKLPQAFKAKYNQTSETRSVKLLQSIEDLHYGWLPT